MRIANIVPIPVYIMILGAMFSILFFFWDATRDYQKVEVFEATGKVVDIDWKSKNHQVPAITIEDNENLKKFTSGRITLSSKDIKVGDDFVKIAGSNECAINSVLIKCFE